MMASRFFLVAVACALWGCAATSPTPVTQNPPVQPQPQPAVHDPAESLAVMSDAPGTGTHAPAEKGSLLATVLSNEAIERAHIMTLFNMAMEASRTALANGQYARAQREVEYALQLVDQNEDLLAVPQYQVLIDQANLLKAEATPE